MSKSSKAKSKNYNLENYDIEYDIDNKKQFKDEADEELDNLLYKMITHYRTYDERNKKIKLHNRIKNSFMVIASFIFIYISVINVSQNTTDYNSFILFVGCLSFCIGAISQLI